MDIGSSVSFDIGPALAALDKLGLAGTSLRDEQLRSNAAVSQSFSTVAQSAVAYSNELAKQQAEVRNASAATKSAMEEVRRLTDANKDLAAAQKVTTNADEVKRLGVELAKNTAKIKEAKQAIAENKAATDQERAGVVALQEARRLATNETRLAAGASRDAATAAKQAAATEKQAAAEVAAAERAAALAAKERAAAEKQAAATADKEVRSAGILVQLEKQLADLTERRARATTKVEAQGYSKEIAGVNQQIASLKTPVVTDAGLEIGKSTGGFLGSLKALGPAVAAAFSIAAIKEFASNVNEAAKTLDTIKGKLNFATGSPEAAARELSFLRSEANRLGLDLSSTALTYGSFIAAAKEGNVPLAEARRTFLAVSGATASLKLSAADTQGVLLALQQIISKGTVSAEELRGQIGERLPGAFSIAARSIGVTETQLNKLLQSGSVVSAQFLPKFTRELEKTFGDGSAAAADALQANENRIANEWQAFLQRFEGLAGATTGVIAKFAAQANKFLDSFTTAGRLRQASQGAQQGIKDYGDTLDKLFSVQAERAKKNGEDVTKAVADVAAQQGLVLQKQLATAQQELAKFDTSTKEGSLFQGNFRGGSEAFNTARQEALRRVELIKGEQAAIGERAEAFKKASEAELTQTGRIIALRAKILADTKTRDETADTKAGNAERVRLNALIKDENKLLDELLGKEEKVRKARQYSYESQLRALLAERATLTSLAAKAAEQQADDATARAKAVFDEGLRQVGVVQVKLEQGELDLRKAAAKVGGGAVAKLGEKADGVVDGVQEQQLAALRITALDKYYADLYAITKAREQRLFDLRAESDAKEVEAVDRKYDAFIKRTTDNIERQAIEEARAREQLALKAAQEQKRIDQTAALGAATAQAVGQQYGTGTGVSVFEARRAEARALLDIEKQAAQDSLNNTLNKTGKEAEIERQALRAQLGRIKNQQQELSIQETLGKFSIYKLILGENDNDETRAALDKVASTVVSGLAEITAAEEQAAANRVAVSNQVITELTGQLAAQIQLNAAGSASNIKGLQDQIAAEKATRREALDDQRKAAKERVLIDGLTQASSIATAAASVFATFAALGPLGVIGGIGAATLLIGAFVAAKAKAYEAAGNIGQGYYRGGYTGGTDEREERGVVHGKEFVHTAEKTVRYRTLFDALHTDRPEIINWQLPHMQALLPRERAALLPDVELPDKLRTERADSLRVQHEHSFAPMQTRFDRMDERLAAIERSNGRMADRPERLPLGNGKIVEITENGSTHVKDLSS